MSNISKGLQESRNNWDSNMPGYQGDYGGADNWDSSKKAFRRQEADHEWKREQELTRQREEQEARLAQYNQSGKFWLKIKDTQRHLPAGPFIGKQSATQAAIDLLKKQPELKGNLVITAYGPGESQGVAEGEKSPMFKDAQRADRVRSLKNLIAIAREQGRQLRVQELELELKKLQGVTEMDKSSPQPGRDGRVSHSTYGSRDKGGSKGTERAAQPITTKKAAQHALDILKKQGVAEGSLNEFAVDGFGDSSDHRSKLLASVGRLFDAGNKVDWQVPGQMGHVTRVQDDGITMKKWKKPHSRMSFFLPIRDDSRDSKYTIKMIGPKHYAVVSAEQGVAEGYHDSKTIITEALIVQKLWEDAGHKLMEAQLTIDQINQIFQQVEQGATAAGNNRTMLGKGKDAVSAVNKAWETLKDKVSTSGPIKNVDAMYDTAAEKLKQATGGDQGVMQYVQKYRDFAKKHPVAQSLIYSALIAAAGISGVGAGGAAALGLFKLVDKLLQGEKFSSAAYAGAKTGGMAYAAGQIGQAMKGQTPSTSGATDAVTTSMPTDLSAIRQQASREAMKAVQDALAGGTDPRLQGELANIAQSVLEKYSTLQGGPLSVQTAESLAQKIAMQAAAKAGGLKESIDLTESQIYLVVGNVVARYNRQVNEGIMDTIKGAAGKAVDWAKTKGINLTTKVTADKLLQAWKKAGSPMDSLDVAKVIQNIGVPSDTIKQVYGSMKIPFAGQPGGGAMPQSVKSTQQATPAASAAAPAAKMTVPAQQTTIPQVAPVAKATAPVAKVAAATAPQGFNASNVMKMPGMEKYAKPAVAKPANFSGGPTGYASVNTTFKQPAKQTSMAEDELDENCWKGYHKEGNKKLFGKTVPNCVKNEDVAEDNEEKIAGRYTPDEFDEKIKRLKDKAKKNPVDNAELARRMQAAYKKQDEQGLAEEQHSCPHCGGPMFSEMIMNEKKDACYYKVKSRYKVWPSAYASGALVKCRKSGADNWGNGGKKNESSILEGIERADENLHKWFKEKWVRFGPDGKIRGDCARGDDSEGKPKCLPQSKAHSLGKKGRASAAARKRREDPNPERSGKAINVNTKKKANEEALDEKWSQKYKDSINCSNPKGFSQKAHCASKQKNESSILEGIDQLDEGWRQKLGAAALTGAMALGAGAAQARVGDDADAGINRITGKPIATQQANDTAPTATPAATVAGQGLVRAERADKQAGTVTVGGQDYKMIMLEPGGLRPRGGQKIAIPQDVMGERGIGNYIGILIGDRVFVLPNNN